MENDKTNKVLNNTDKENKSEDKVELSKSTLETILKRIESQDETIKTLSERDKRRDSEIEMLKSISDKARLARFEQQTKGPLVKNAKVSFWDDTPILAWQTVKDEVGFKDGRVVVSQIVRIILDAIDEETKRPKTLDLDYLHWVQNVRCINGEVVEKTETDNRIYWTVQMEDGRKIKLDTTFINAF